VAVDAVVVVAAKKRISKEMAADVGVVVVVVVVWGEQLMVFLVSSGALGWFSETEGFQGGRENSTVKTTPSTCFWKKRGLEESFICPPEAHPTRKRERSFE